MNEFFCTPSLHPEGCLRLSIAAMLTGALLIGAANAAAAPAQPALTASIHHNTRAALHQIRAQSRPSPKLVMPAAPYVAAVPADAQGTGIVGTGRRAVAEIVRAQRAQLKLRSQASLETTLVQARPASRPVRIGMLEMLRTLTENAAAHWLPEISPWLAPRPGAAWFGDSSFWPATGERP